MSVSRNDSCPCGSGKKYKKCCLNAADERRKARRNRSLLMIAILAALTVGAWLGFGEGIASIVGLGGFALMVGLALATDGGDADPAVKGK